MDLDQIPTIVLVVVIVLVLGPFLEGTKRYSQLSEGSFFL